MVRSMTPTPSLPWLGALRGAAILGLLGAAPVLAGPTISIEPGEEDRSVRVSVDSTHQAGLRLLEILDASGACVRTLHAGRLAPREPIEIQIDETLPKGRYLVRYREGVELALAGEVKRPDDSGPGWLNPTDVALAGAWVYVFDAGREVSDPARPQPQSDLPSIFKMDRQGRPDLAFADRGRLVLSYGYGLFGIRAFAADDQGLLYVTSTSHEVLIFDAHGKRTGRAVGGWDNDPQGSKCTVWVHSIALGWKNHIYIPNGGYGNGRVYDRTRNRFDGILYSFALPQFDGFHRYVCADSANGAVYFIGRSQLITRYLDDGQAIKPTYQSDPEFKLAQPTGGSASGGLLWVACHGPGYGPFWDSGGGGEVVLFWDDGREFRLLSRFGAPGVAADRLEFLNPSATAMSLDHTELWVAEDTLKNKEGPPGNGRVRRFLLRAATTCQAPLDLSR